MNTAKTTTLTIPKKMSGTGTIHDMASDNFDRHIEFDQDEHFAVLTPAFFGTSYSCYNGGIDFEEMKIEYNSHESNRIIDRHGNMYVLEDGVLIRYE